MSDLFIGVQTQDNATLTTAGITGASINNAGFLGKFDRGIDAVVEVSNNANVQAYFGRYRSSMYGNYVLSTFFKNLQGQPGTAWVKRMVPSDAVAATVNLENASASDTWQLDAGRIGYIDKGAWGNQLRVLVLASSRGSSTLSTATANLDTVIEVDSVAPFKVGDWVKVNGASTYSAKITAIDELSNTLTLGTAAGGINAVGQIVEIVDRTIKVYMKDSDTGNLDLVETISNVTDTAESPHYFVTVINDQFTGSGYLKATKLVTGQVGTVADFPVTVADSVANVLALTSGAEGTPLTVSQQAAQLSYFDPYPIIYLANTESFAEEIWDDGEAYCNTRKDCVWIGCPTENMSYAAALVWENKRRKSRKIYATNVLNWVKEDDPLGSGPLPVKNIPNVGVVIGFSIFITTVRGIHKVNASRLQTLAGIRGIVGEIVPRAQLRDLANAGLNCITDLVGSYAIRSARTPSKLKEWTFSNALFMSIYFKKSFENSLVDLENEPNTAALLTRIREAMTTFAFAFYTGSSNGGPEGGFASFLKPGGTQSNFADAVKIVADDSNNPISKVNAGELRADFWFMAPAPAERILVGVGLLFLQ